MKKRKFILSAAAFALLFSFGLAACGGGGEGGDSKPAGSSAAKQEKITVTAEGGKSKLILGETVQLTAKVGDDVIQGVTWTSSKPEFATVSDAGLVTSVAKGTTQIKAIKEGYKDGALSITVDYETITVSVAAGGKTSLLVGETVQLNADKQGVTWASSDTDVATVSDTGLVTAAKYGTVTITASGNNLNPGSQEISVVRPAPTATLHMEDADHYSADGMWGTSYSGTFYGPGDESPVYNRSSGNASDGTCIAYMDNGDQEILTFTSNAAVKAELVMMMASRNAVSDMSSVMTVTFNTDAIALSGKEFPGGGDTNTFIEFSFGEVNIKNGENKLKFDFLGSSPYMDDLNIYAESAATIAVVKPAAKDPVVVNQTSLELAECQLAQITSTMTGLTYKSNNGAIATVDATGLVRGVGAGETTISVSKEGYATIKVPVKVNEDPNAFVVAVDGIEGEGISHRDSQNISGDYKHMIESMEVNAVGTIAFTAPETGLFSLVLRSRSSGGYSNTSQEDDLATCMTLKINGVKLDLTGTVKGSSFNNYYLGNINLDKTNCEIEITCLTAVPQINLFRFVPAYLI